MTVLKDMSATQRQSWMTLMADGCVFIWLITKFLPNFSTLWADKDLGLLSGILLKAVIITVVLHIGIAITFALIAGQDDSKDERDIAVERRGAYWGYRILQIGLAVVVVGILVPEWVSSASGLPVQVNHLGQVIIALAILSYVADLVKHGVMILSYGR